MSEAGTLDRTPLRISNRFARPMRQVSPLWGTGHPLDASVRSEMERVLGHNLADVRVHLTKQAGELARRLEADAFTIGVDIFAPEEKIRTATIEGKALLAHELTHVIQQTRPASLAEAPTGEKFPVKDNAARAPQLAAAASRTTLSGEEGHEAEAGRIESYVREARGSVAPIEAAVDVEEIAVYVYRLMQQELLLEAERGAEVGEHA